MTVIRPMSRMQAITTMNMAGLSTDAATRLRRLGMGGPSGKQARVPLRIQTLPNSSRPLGQSWMFERVG
jgi:hypothetical protein